jgi:hypothetical protein
LIFAGRGDDAMKAEWLEVPVAGPATAAGAGFSRAGSGGAANLLSAATLIFAVWAEGGRGFETGIFE